MKSPNEQYQIAQELSKIGPSAKLVEYEITCYETNDDYRLAISNITGMFTETYIKSVINLSQKFGFNWFVSESCLPFPDGGLFIIIY